MPKLKNQRWSQARKGDFVIQRDILTGKLFILGSFEEYFVSGGKVHVKVEELWTFEKRHYILDTPDAGNAFFVVDSSED